MYNPNSAIFLHLKNDGQAGQIKTYTRILET